MAQLLNPQEVLDYLPGVTGTQKNAQILQLAERADGLLAGWLGYPSASVGVAPTLLSQTYTLYLKGPGGRRLIVPVAPLTTVTTIENDSEEEFDGVSELVASSDYDVRDLDDSGNHGVVLLKHDAAEGSWLATDRRVIKIVCVAGYTVIPHPLRHALIIITAHLYKQQATLGRVTVPSPQGGSVVPKPESVPSEAWTYAAPYRLWDRWLE